MTLSIDNIPSKIYQKEGGQWIFHYCVLSTPLGHCFIAGRDRALCVLFWIDPKDKATGLSALRKTWPLSAFKEVSGDFSMDQKGSARAQNQKTLRLLVRGTDFQVNVWRALLEIPVGQTTPYAALAKKVGRPRAVRAVANAVGANPISSLIPCHRVVRSDGSLGGYRWGLEMKQVLLKAEADKSTSGNSHSGFALNKMVADFCAQT